MDELDLLINSKLASRKAILDSIDEYSLYCYYLERDDIVPGKPISSPIRAGDANPSFSIFPASKGKGYDEFEFTWSDRATGQSGNIFHLVKILHPNLKTFDEVYNLISQDFDLGLGSGIKAEKIVLYDCPDPVNINIRIRSIPYTQNGSNFWSQFRIDDTILKPYFTNQIDCLWTYDEQQYPMDCPDPTFAYQVGKYYQIYSPTALKKNKFRNNLPPEYFLGYLQLPKQGDLLVYDKSMKDLMFCRRLGYWAVAGKAETVEIPEKKMYELKDRFKRHILTLDPDKAGLTQTEKYTQKYPWLEPRFLTQAKDKTDLCKAVGFEEAEKIIKQLLS